MRWVLFLMLPTVVQAESVIATRPIAAQSILRLEDLAVVAAEIPGALDGTVLAVGKETRRPIGPGQPVRAEDLITPMLFARNARVTMRFAKGGLMITAEGRALDPGGIGEEIRVMSLSSRSIVQAEVLGDGSVLVK